jgi:hypothetical protein
MKQLGAILKDPQVSTYPGQPLDCVRVCVVERCPNGGRYRALKVLQMLVWKYLIRIAAPRDCEMEFIVFAATPRKLICERL